MRETEKWFVVQCMTGTEEKVRLLCERRIPKTVMSHCYIPYYKEKRRVRGEWKQLRKVLFPGYLILAAHDSNQLNSCLKKAGLFLKLLRSGEVITPLTREEQQLLQRLGGVDQVMEMSEGLIENSVVQIYSGPLCGMEACIKKIDRHKRKAWLELSMFGRMQLIEVGLEIVAKS